jgi:SAM-dependent methyltransferase
MTTRGPEQIVSSPFTTKLHEHYLHSIERVSFAVVHLMFFNPPATSYDEVPYEDNPCRSSHPDNLATVAILSGLSPKPVNDCRVLELGCARGGNLIPMAFSLPRSHFVGIDSSPGQINEALDLIGALGLSNIKVESRSILDVDSALGTFDYIVCHGTFSWVSADVQEKILEICARNLAPSGIAYVSYNTYPGWHMVGLVREMMSYHVRRYDRPTERAAQARSLLQFMTTSALAYNPVYGGLLKAELDIIRDRPDAYLLHDHLETVNEPVYFHDFIDRAAAKGLQYVSEVQDSLIVPESLPYLAADGLRQLANDHLEFEQFADFVINRRFRQSVLCHSGAAVRRTVSTEGLDRLHVASRHQRPKVAVPFRNGHFLGVALHYLNEIWPRSASFPSLWQVVRKRVETAATAEAPVGRCEAGDLGSDLRRCYSLKLVELSTVPSSFVVEISEKPVASRLARLQAAAGNTVTNLRHEANQLGDFGRFVIRHLDGAHDRQAIRGLLSEALKAGRLSVPQTERSAGGQPVGRERPVEVVLEELVDRCLKKFARFALLVG